MSEDAGGSRPLVNRSLEIICDNQHPDGGFPAAPDHPTYRYSWIRDGAFIAYALDRYGHHQRAAAFHRWTARTILEHRQKVDLLTALPPGTPLPDEAILHTRYTLDGEEALEDWGNFQLDGYGFWLSSLARHLTLTGADPKPYREAVEVVTRYLTLSWRYPCYDCWEEYPTRRHPTSLAAVAAGLRNASDLLDDPGHAHTADTIMEDVADHGTHRGSLLKLLQDRPTPRSLDDGDSSGLAAVAGHEHTGKPVPSDGVDASALLILSDLGPYPPGSATATATLSRIEADLAINGGVHRYLGDEYYGGGLWVLLSGALAVVCAQRGDLARAAAVIGWIEDQADLSGNLPEQVASTLRHPSLRQPWIDRWGPVGNPLLWSHAMYLTAAQIAAPKTSGFH